MGKPALDFKGQETCQDGAGGADGADGAVQVRSSSGAPVAHLWLCGVIRSRVVKGDIHEIQDTMF